MTTAEVDRRLSERLGALPHGRAGFQSFVASTGERLSDVSSEVEAEIAARKLRQLATAEAGRVTASEVATYYREHQGLFERRERRDFMIVEGIRSPQAARRAIGRNAFGSRFGTTILRESLNRPRNFDAGEKEAIERAIFSSKAGVWAGPVKLHDYYAVFRVTRVRPASRQSLVQVRRTIRAKLVLARQRHQVAAFSGAWERKWQALTTCAPNAVVSGCRQGHRMTAAEEYLSG